MKYYKYIQKNYLKMKSSFTLFLVLLTSICFSQTWQIQLKNDTLPEPILKLPSFGNLFNYTYTNLGSTELVFDFTDKSLLIRKPDSIFYYNISEVIKLKDDFFHVSIECDEGYVCQYIMFTKYNNQFVVLFEEFIDREIWAHWSKVKSLDIKQ